MTLSGDIVTMWGAGVSGRLIHEKILYYVNRENYSTEGSHHNLLRCRLTHLGKSIRNGGFVVKSKMLIVLFLELLA